MDFDAYRKLPFVNWSSLKHLARSPMHYRHYLANPPRDTSAMALGRACHAAVFEPFRLASDFVIYEDRRYGKKWDAFADEHAHQTILTPTEWERADGIRSSIEHSGVLAPYLSAGQSEYTITWPDIETGVSMKARLDYISSSTPAILDLKSTHNITERLFAQQIARMRYHCQAAVYTDGYEQWSGQRLPWGFIAVEQMPPHDHALYWLDDESIFAGQEEYRELLRKLQQCQRDDVWPGQYPQAQAIRLPPWVWHDDDEATDTSDEPRFRDEGEIA